MSFSVYLDIFCTLQYKLNTVNLQEGLETKRVIDSLFLEKCRKI